MSSSGGSSVVSLFPVGTVGSGAAVVLSGWQDCRASPCCIFFNKALRITDIFSMSIWFAVTLDWMSYINSVWIPMLVIPAQFSNSKMVGQGIGSDAVSRYAAAEVRSRRWIPRAFRTVMRFSKGRGSVGVRSRQWQSVH